ncbi:hypothetical protein vBBaMIFTN8_38 [Bordetella phage vB_BaM-IFTN8]|nr:hypothetical protein vBBaMIFTN8_38 [Bordetella phage vB_BaM-IFTN8]
MWPGINPLPMRSIRFVTGGAISTNIEAHGIDGYFRAGRYWSRDGADHWETHEIKAWRYQA